MKKVKKQASLENILSYDELSVLKGGKFAIRNVNSEVGCNCDYDNTSLTNKNTVGSCSCTCI